MILEVRILKGLQGEIAEVRIPKDLRKVTSGERRAASGERAGGEPGGVHRGVNMQNDTRRVNICQGENATRQSGVEPPHSVGRRRGRD